MQKIVINGKYGGFGLSDEAVLLYGQLSDILLIAEQDRFCTHWYRDEVDTINYFSPHEIQRDDPHLVQVVETLGDAAGTKYARLKVVEIPDDVQWTIEEYDGIEWIAEVHRTWS